ncbi:hypothetical protein [Streptomyces sp. NPDC003393]
MTVHVVSVGSNLIDAMAAPSGVTGLDVDQADAIRDERPAAVLSDIVGSDSAQASQELAACLTAGTDQHRHLLELVDAVAPGRWSSGISAELDTLSRAPGGIALQSDTDVAVLLATPTVHGLTAALWNALALTDGKPERIDYLPAPEQQPPAAVRGHVLVVRVPGLEPREQNDFHKAMKALGTLGRALVTKVAESDDEDFHFHLSGGYKAAIPYLIGLAEGIRSLPRGRNAVVQAFMLHRDTQGEAIRLPLRRMNLKMLRATLEPFRATGRKRTAPDDEALDGYAYDLAADGTQYELTPFGAGLLALIGHSEEPVGT